MMLLNPTLGTGLIYINSSLCWKCSDFILPSAALIGKNNTGMVSTKKNNTKNKVGKMKSHDSNNFLRSSSNRCQQIPTKHFHPQRSKQHVGRLVFTHRISSVSPRGIQVQHVLWRWVSREKIQKQSQGSTWSFVTEDVTDEDFVSPPALIQHLFQHLHKYGKETKTMAKFCRPEICSFSHPNILLLSVQMR